MAATRPELLFGLPYSLAATLLLMGILFIVLYGTGHPYSDLVVDVIVLGAIGMVWSTAKIVLRTDYHGWDILVAWGRLDARLLDTAENGGARLTSFPLHSVYRCEVYGDAD